LMTGTDVESVEVDRPELAVDTALSKPFELEKLFFVVESALSADEEREGRG